METAAFRRAMRYPYAAPTGDCVWTRNGGVTLLDATDVNAVAAGLERVGANPRARRTPVLAIGSNRAPEQLARKFQDFEDPAAVILAKAQLAEFDVVYGAGVAGYGAVGGATLAPSPGTSVEVWVTWLDDQQMQRMHETEGLSAGVYAFLELQKIDLAFASGPRWDAVAAYVQRGGALTLGGEPVALAEVPAKGRRYQAMAQAQMQRTLAARFAADKPLEGFVAENIASPDLRAARAAALKANAAPFDWPHVTDRTPRTLWRPGT